MKPTAGVGLETQLEDTREIRSKGFPDSLDHPEPHRSAWGVSCSGVASCLSPYSSPAVGGPIA